MSAPLLKRLFHWSDQPNLTYLDPSYYGRGLKGDEALRVQQGAPLRSYYYTQNIVPEAGLGPNQYFTDVDAAKLYDLRADPEGIYADALARFTTPDRQTDLGTIQGIVDRQGAATAAELELVKRGYLGYVGDNSSAAVFQPLDVQPMHQYAQGYPPVGTPQQVTDPKTGKSYMAKTPSADEQMLQQARMDANKAIKAGDYDPYFRLEDRYYANPDLYDIQGDTLTDAMPKKQATIDKWREKLHTPEATERLQAGYAKGQSLGNAEKWYAMGQWQDEYIKLLGPEEGARRYKEDFADAMAATTGGADPGSNLAMATYGNYLRERGLAMPKGAYEMPHPIGGRYATGNMRLYDKFLGQGEELTAAGNPKRFNFRQNFLGDTSRATIDEQMSKGMFDLNAPPTNAYGIAEGVVVDEAARLGIPAAEVQDVAWAGFKGVQGKPMMEWLNEAIARTAKVTGQSQEDVVKSVIMKRGPLYGLVGAAMVGSMTPEEAEAAPMGELAKRLGMKTRQAWHGSPHDFDKFDLAHIGTGEGAQAYGWGQYLSSSKGIARDYRDNLSSYDTIVDGVSIRGPGYEQKLEGLAVDLQQLRPDIQDTPGASDLKRMAKNVLDEAITAANVDRPISHQVKRLNQYADEAVERANSQYRYLEEKLGMSPERVDQALARASAGDPREVYAEDLIAFGIPEEKVEQYGVMSAVEDLLYAKLDARDYRETAELLPELVTEARTTSGGKLYEAEIPDETHLLDWDKPYAEQSDWVKEKLAPLLDERMENTVKLERGDDDALIPDVRGKYRWVRYNPDGRREASFYVFDSEDAAMSDAREKLMSMPGRDLYYSVVPRETRVSDNPAKQASEKLRDLGIPGHTYLGRTSDERNYVMYDVDKYTNIVNKGQVDPKLLAGLGAATAAALAYRQRRREKADFWEAGKDMAGTMAAGMLDLGATAFGYGEDSPLRQGIGRLMPEMGPETMAALEIMGEEAAPYIPEFMDETMAGQLIGGYLEIDTWLEENLHPQLKAILDLTVL